VSQTFSQFADILLSSISGILFKDNFENVGKGTNFDDQVFCFISKKLESILLTKQVGLILLSIDPFPCC
jgi:hypothetical protein